ncbi:MAG TPA: hypothetical protein VGC92_07815 [Phenylobacterium sp.]|jgi:hypothetical protein
MSGRDEQIYREAAALWRELHGEDPPPPGDSAAILAMITGSLPDVSYSGLCSPYLRPTTITAPSPGPRRKSV